MRPGIACAWILVLAIGGPAVAEDMAGILEVRSFLAKRSEQDYRITAERGIDEARCVRIGGIEQYISVRGEDRGNPVILFLHGGKALGGQVAIPFFIIQGAEDFTTSRSLAQEFVASLRASRKELVALPGAGHFAVFMKSDEFLRELVSRVRPLAPS